MCERNNFFWLDVKEDLYLIEPVYGWSDCVITKFKEGELTWEKQVTMNSKQQIMFLTCFCLCEIIVFIGQP